MIVQNGYGNMWTPSQGVQSAVTEQKTPQESAASVTTQARAQGAAETQTQQRVESRDQAQAANASVATNPFEQYQRTGSLSVYA
jgi:hypothetical protein